MGFFGNKWDYVIAGVIAAVAIAFVVYYNQ